MPGKPAFCLWRARFHGNVLKLQPRTPTAADPRRFALEPVSAGHRFPMGLALNHAGDLFVTDNQGNYKPFNELNHVRQGANFGFINFPDRARESPRRTMPAIDIPHPWTRSVNGICFLYTPKELRARLGHDVFGPMEGHLVGCEYDTRRLIRMSLQKVGDTYQGPAYPLASRPRTLRGIPGAAGLRGVAARRALRGQHPRQRLGCGQQYRRDRARCASIPTGFLAVSPRSGPRMTASSSISCGRSIAPWPGWRTATGSNRTAEKRPRPTAAPTATAVSKR